MSSTATVVSDRTSATRNGDLTTQRYQIAVLPGDGIGPEITQAALTVIEAASRAFPTLEVTLTQYEAGANHYLRTGRALPDVVLADCLNADAVLLAAIGLPDVRKPDGTEVQPDMMVGLRRALGLYAGVRPVKLYPGVECPLKTADAGIDLVILRENLEGLFASYGGGCLVDDQVATDTIVVTREGTRRVVEYAFHLAASRKGRPLDGRQTVTCVDKANVFRSFAFFRKVFFEVAACHPRVTADAAYVDAMSLYLVQNPGAYDVLVMENQFGDILSDLGAAIVGGLGMAPSAEIGEKHAMFQPSHGSAPTLAGKNVANPLAMILSAAMMFDWLGDRHADPAATALGQSIEAAVKRMLAHSDIRTPDLGGTASTSDVARAVVDYLTHS
ncbi:MAG TPA: isocitrate/isopropylmalate dehydrogenase family protein [Caulifigura sp.]|jgi:3-isopropylmalate dehydrogenase|nr:isocitrate/isopropylmalate dehydrogenase family protein [Caulifigura sp.]